MQTVNAIGPLDGRYARLTGELADIFSESGLIRHRVHVEIQWLKFILFDLKLTPVSKDPAVLDPIVDQFGTNDVQRVKAIEKKTNHDVKAVEYFIKEKLDVMGLSEIREWVHFACTSEDINNTAYALMMKKGRHLAGALLGQCVEEMEHKARAYQSIPMMSRTHGQPATPTTMGKEFVNFAWRLNQEKTTLEQIKIQAKINGATGNYNAHHFVFPEIDWMDASRRFISSCPGAGTDFVHHPDQSQWVSVLSAPYACKGCRCFDRFQPGHVGIYQYRVFQTTGGQRRNRVVHHAP